VLPFVERLHALDLAKVAGIFATRRERREQVVARPVTDAQGPVGDPPGAEVPPERHPRAVAHVEGIVLAEQGQASADRLVCPIGTRE
jgi:hypothetical protein